MANKFRNLLKKFCEESSILGLKYFYLYPDFISRCFWTVNMLGILSLACFLTFLLWNRFREMPTRITIENQYAPILELPYPAITICTPNQMTINNVKHFKRTLVDGNISMDFKKELPQLLGFYEHMTWSNADVLKQFQELIDLNRYNIREVMASFPQSCDEFLIQCLIERRVIDCNKMFRPILTPHGLCCIFNSPYSFYKKRNIFDPHFHPIKPNKTGILEGVTVIVDHKPDDALDGTLLSAGGIRIMFTDWTEFPSDDESSLVYPNVESFHGINGIFTYCSEEVTTLSIESRNCVFEDERRLEFFREYHNSNCDLECLVQKVWHHCNCVLLYMPVGTKKRICDVTAVPCIMHIKRYLAINSSFSRCDCPRNCVSRRYEVTTNFADFKARKYLVLRNYFDNVTLTKSSTLLRMYFSRPFYTQHKQETVISLINLTSNLGGVFGMCLGCSVVSVLEILYFIYKAIRITRNRAISHGRRCRRTRFIK